MSKNKSHLKLVVDNGKLIDQTKDLVLKQKELIDEKISIQRKLKPLIDRELIVAKEIIKIEEEIIKLTK